MRKKSLFRVDHAINILARSAARNAVKEQMCDQGVRVTLVPTREIDEKATIYLEEHPELFDQARERALRLGMIAPPMVTPDADPSVYLNR